MLKALEEIFGAGSQVDLELMDSSFFERCISWDMDGVYLGELMQLATECGDSCFKEQISFVSGLHRILQALAPVAAWMMDAAALDANNRLDAIAVNTDRATMLARLRAEYRHFQAHANSVDLVTLFAQHDGVLSPILQDKFAGAAVAINVVRRTEQAMGELSGQWSEHLGRLTEQIKNWCPGGFHDEGERKQILANPGLIEAMIKNQHYKTLPTACNVLGTMREALLPFASDGTGLDPPVSPKALEEAANVRKMGIACVAFTYGVFLTLHEAKKTANDVVRKKLIDEYETDCKEKGVILDKTDLSGKLAELKRPGAVS